MSEDNYKRITFRLPNDLHIKMVGESKKSGRSMNAEIIHRLEESFNNSNPDKMASVMESLINKVQVLEQRIDKQES